MNPSVTQPSSHLAGESLGELYRDDQKPAEPEWAAPGIPGPPLGSGVGRLDVMRTLSPRPSSAFILRVRERTRLSRVEKSDSAVRIWKPSSSSSSSSSPAELKLSLWSSRKPRPLLEGKAQIRMRYRSQEGEASGTDDLFWKNNLFSS